MSASSKKKLRNEQNAAKIAERKATEQQEAKKLKVMTTLFTVTLALIVVVAAVFAVVQFVKTSGIREKNTVAVTIGGKEISNAQLNYYFVDAVNEFATNYGSYASMFGLDVTKPLNEQVINEETGATWADDFLMSAKNDAQSIFALCAAAEAAGFEAPATVKSNVDTQMTTLEIYAIYNNYTDVKDYIKAIYGPGASVESYREYVTMRETANAYYSHYATSLTYEEADLRAGEEGKEAEFSQFSYNYFYVNVNKFLQGGTTAEDGTVTYSDEERAAAVKAAEAAAKSLAESDIASVEDLDAAISAMEINAGSETPVTSTKCSDYSYANVTSVAREWITDASRKAGDMTFIENASTTTAEDGTENKTVNGYYVVYFVGSTDNNYPLANVRHILVKPEGGTYNSSTGMTDYTVEEKAAAQLVAQDLLDQFLSGKAIEENFASMAKEHSTDSGSKDNGGLYENVYPGQMVVNFNDWCFDEARKPGDTGLVESDYGWHVMYYVSDSETLYRDYLIENALRSADTDEWYRGLLESHQIVEGNTSYLSNDLVLSRG